MLGTRGFRLPRKRQALVGSAILSAVALAQVVQLSPQLFEPQSQDVIGEVEISVGAAKRRRWGL